jgi:hypothetical protein
MRSAASSARSYVFALCLCLCVAPALAQFRTPQAAIVALYASYGLGNDSTKTGFDDKLAAQVFNKSLFDLYRKTLNSDNLDYDFFVQGNAFSLVKPIEIGTVTIEGTRAKVAAVLTQKLADSAPVSRFLFSLVKSHDGWQIDDAFYDGKSVRAVWEKTIKEAN